LATALREAGFEIHLYREYLADNVDDVTWMRFAASRGWIAITRDKAIRRSPLEIHALRAAGLGAFFVSSGQITGDEIRDRLLKFLPAMVTYSRGTNRPFLATLTSKGIVALV